MKLNYFLLGLTWASQTKIYGCTHWVNIARLRLQVLDNLVQWLTILQLRAAITTKPVVQSGGGPNIQKTLYTVSLVQSDKSDRLVHMRMQQTTHYCFWSQQELQ